MFAIIGIIGGIIYILGDIPYILDTVKGKTKPHRISWLLFLTLNLIYLANQWSLGARSSLYLVVSWILITLVVFLLSIKKGVGGFAKLDILCLSGAIIGLLLWWILKTPLVSLYCNLLVSTLSYIPTVKKGYFKPNTETHLSWFTTSVAGIFGSISVGKLDAKLLVVPVYSVIVSTAIFSLLVIRTRQLSLSQK
ncbi:MAG TPA: hypothetical protein VMR34_05500 [Candidatus Saccharimonadales bacterium]|nr:hypothetical protein [Candidatus Saccharimonadales bacterium]